MFVKRQLRSTSQTGGLALGAPVILPEAGLLLLVIPSGLLTFITVLPMTGLLGSHVATTRWLPRLADWPWEPRFNEGSLSRGLLMGTERTGPMTSLGQSFLGRLPRRAE